MNNFFKKNKYFLISIGAVPGAMFRWQIDDFFIVNTLGCFFIGIALIIPNKKQPRVFTIKTSSICHRNIAPGIAPIEIRKYLFFFKKLFIYQLQNKEPNTKALVPKEKEKINSFKASKNLYFLHSSNKS